MQLPFQGMMEVFFVDKKGRTARSRHSSPHFVPETSVANLLLKRIVKIGDKGKRA